MEVLSRMIYKAVLPGGGGWGRIGRMYGRGTNISRFQVEGAFNRTLKISHLLVANDNIFCDENV